MDIVQLKLHGFKLLLAYTYPWKVLTPVLSLGICICAADNSYDW